jgi:hypothetical protein
MFDGLMNPVQENRSFAANVTSIFMGFTPAALQLLSFGQSFSREWRSHP